MKTKEEIDKLVNDNMGLVYTCVNKIVKSIGSTHTYDDFVQEASIGLLKAAQKYDESKGIKFSTFACTCITHDLYAYLVKTKRKMDMMEREGIVMCSLDQTLINNINKGAWSGELEPTLEGVIDSGVDIVEDYKSQELLDKLEEWSPERAEFLKRFAVSSGEEIAQELHVTCSAINAKRRRYIEDFFAWLENTEIALQEPDRVKYPTKINKKKKKNPNAKKYNLCKRIRLKSK